jgi:hypothetical protein
MATLALQQPIKTFNVKIHKESEQEILSQFQKHAIAEEQNVGDLTLILMRDWTKKHRKAGRVLATETEVLEAAEAEGLKTNKALLIKYRMRGHLSAQGVPTRNGANRMWWTNPDGRVVYDLKKTLTFLRKRNKDPKSRIGKERV